MSMLSTHRAGSIALNGAADSTSVEPRQQVKRANPEHLLEKSAEDWKDYYDKAADKRQGEWKKTYDAYRHAAQAANHARDKRLEGDIGLAPGDLSEQDLLDALMEEADDALKETMQDVIDEFKRERKEHLSAMPEGEINEAGGSSSKVEDKSGELTRRLVAATHRMQIGDIVAEAFKSILELRMALGSGDAENSKEIKACIRRLEKVVSRCFKKNKELGKEDSMRLEQQRAERNEEEQRAREIEAELRRTIKKRKEREKKYLYEKDEEGDNSVNMNIPSAKLDAATEAQIEMQAKAMASAEMSGGSLSGGASSGGGDMGSMSSGGAQSSEAQVSSGEATASAEVSVE